MDPSSIRRELYVARSPPLTYTLSATGHNATGRDCQTCCIMQASPNKQTNLPLALSPELSQTAILFRPSGLPLGITVPQGGDATGQQDASLGHLLLLLLFDGRPQSHRDDVQVELTLRLGRDIAPRWVPVDLRTCLQCLPPAP